MDQKPQGKHPSTICEGVLKTGNMPGPAYLSASPEYPSAVVPESFFVKRLADLKKLLSDLGQELDAHAQIPEPWPAGKNDSDCDCLTGRDEKLLYQALKAHLFGRSEEVKSYAAILQKHFFPLRVHRFSGKEIIVEKDHPLIIESDGHNPTIVEYERVTLQPGAQIICKAPIVMKVKTFIKK